MHRRAPASCTQVRGAHRRAPHFVVVARRSTVPATSREIKEEAAAEVAPPPSGGGGRRGEETRESIYNPGRATEDTVSSRGETSRTPLILGVRGDFFDAASHHAIYFCVTRTAACVRACVLSVSLFSTFSPDDEREKERRERAENRSSYDPSSFTSCLDSRKAGVEPHPTTYRDALPIDRPVRLRLSVPKGGPFALLFVNPRAARTLVDQRGLKNRRRHGYGADERGRKTVGPEINPLFIPPPKRNLPLRSKVCCLPKRRDFERIFFLILFHTGGRN